MKSEHLSTLAGQTEQQPTHWLLRLLHRRLQRAGISSLRLTTRHGQSVRIGSVGPEPTAHLHIHRPTAVLRALSSGLMGWAEGYMAGDWGSDNLRTLTRWAADNETALKEAFPGGPISRGLHRLWHRLHANSLRGSRRNIASHYDLGNDFYCQWLDSTMSYSSALFSHPQQPLAEAQQAKYNRILQLARPKPGQHFLEIGCGWGGFAETIARHPSLQLHGITLSRAQLEWAQRRMQAANAEDRVTLSYQDYRTLDKQYDRVVSIEMFEAVGEEHWPTFFNTLHRVLKPGGTAVMQIIVIDPQRFEHYRCHTDFIQRYIFPGGMLPTADKVATLAQQHGFDLQRVERFGPDYQRTLAHWYDAFEEQWPSLQAQGFDARFRRMWRYYLAYCEAGFRNGALDVCLFQLQRDTHSEVPV